MMGTHLVQRLQAREARAVVAEDVELAVVLQAREEAVEEREDRNVGEAQRVALRCADLAAESQDRARTHSQ